MQAKMKASFESEPIKFPGINQPIAPAAIMQAKKHMTVFFR